MRDFAFGKSRNNNKSSTSTQIWMAISYLKWELITATFVTSYAGHLFERNFFFLSVHFCKWRKKQATIYLFLLYGDCIKWEPRGLVKASHTPPRFKYCGLLYAAPYFKPCSFIFKLGKAIWICQICRASYNEGPSGMQSNVTHFPIHIASRPCRIHWRIDTWETTFLCDDSGTF
jgi:hypothetical protein